MLSKIGLNISIRKSEVSSIMKCRERLRVKIQIGIYISGKYYLRENKL